MQVYDKVIETTRELLKPFPVKELNRNHAKPWNLLKENEFRRRFFQMVLME